MTMSEKTKVMVKHFIYEGIFNYREFFRTMDFWLRDKFYDKKEKLNFKYITPEGSEYQLHFEPWKKVTDFYKIELMIEVLASKVKDVEVEIDGKPVKMQKGRIEVMITSWLIIDYKNSMEKKPFHYFMRELFVRFVYKHITKKYWEMAVDEATDLEMTLRSYLNTLKNRTKEIYETGREHTRYA